MPSLLEGDRGYQVAYASASDQNRFRLLGGLDHALSFAPQHGIAKTCDVRAIQALKAVVAALAAADAQDCLLNLSDHNPWDNLGRICPNVCDALP
jgi:hypothetical protein